MSLYIAQIAGRDDRALLRASIVRLGFSRAALVFGPFWLLYQRLWIAALVWIVAEAAFIIFALPHVGPDAGLAVDALAHFWLGFEATQLLAAKAGRRAVVTDLVEAGDRDEAEIRVFHRLLPPPLPAVAATGPAPEPGLRVEPVV